MDEATYGLSWSQRWHVIDRNYPDKRDTVSLCGRYIYTQQQVRDDRASSVLREIVEDPEKAAGVCKPCTRKAEKLP